MKHFRLAAALVPLALAVSPADAAVTVAFIGQPASYLDIGMTTWTRDDNLKAIESMLKELGAQYAPSKDIKFEILDVDLAGRDNLGRGGRAFRTLTGNGDYPSFILRYSVDGGPMQQETVEDRMFYTSARINTSEPMYYERRMFEGWFKERFGGAK